MTDLNQDPEEAIRDSRTHLANRDTFYRDMGPLLSDHDPDELDLVLLVLDVDGIDFALQTFGPFHRDTLVRDVAERLGEGASGKATPYHIMQGRFALVLSGVSYRQATRTARSVVEAFRQSFQVNGAPYRLEVQVGLSHYPNHADSLSEWVRTAVFATHQARVKRCGYAVYDQDWDRRERERFRLMVDLGEALDAGGQMRLAPRYLL